MAKVARRAAPALLRALFGRLRRKADGGLTIDGGRGAVAVGGLEEAEAAPSTTTPPTPALRGVPPAPIGGLPPPPLLLPAAAVPVWWWWVPLLPRAPTDGGCGGLADGNAAAMALPGVEKRDADWAGCSICCCLPRT